MREKGVGQRVQSGKKKTLELDNDLKQVVNFSSRKKVIRDAAHRHGFIDEAWKRSGRTTVRKKTPRPRRALRAQAPKNEMGDHSGLAVEYWITGIEPVRYHVEENLGTLRRELENKGRRRKGKRIGRKG